VANEPDWLKKKILAAGTSEGKCVGTAVQSNAQKKGERTKKKSASSNGPWASRGKRQKKKKEKRKKKTTQRPTGGDEGRIAGK